MALSSQRAVVWGAGAIGSIIGTGLLAAGRDITFVDVNAAHLARIRAGDLVIGGVGGGRAFQAPAFTPDDAPGGFDVALLCVRLNDTAEALRALVPRLAEGACVIVCQNGFGARTVAGQLGEARTIAASFFLPANFQGPGRVLYGSRADIAIGTVAGGRSPALDHAAQVLAPLDMDLHVSDDVNAVIWSKLCYGALLAAAALDDGVIADFLAAPRLRPIVLSILREMTTIAARSGHRAENLAWFQPEVIAGADSPAAQASLDATLARLRRSTKPISGYWTQIVQHRRQSELGPMFDPVLRDAERTGCPARVLRRLFALIADMEAGRATNGPELMDSLLTTALAPAPGEAESTSGFDCFAIKP